MAVNVTILAAGKGTRLGMPDPKPLTKLHDGRSIMQQQIENVRSVFGTKARILVVVGFRFYRVVESFPDVVYLYNDEFDTTNTSKSLLRALGAHPKGGVLWLNGDVVFDPQVLERLRPHIDADESVVAVNTAKVSDEEVKYRVDDDGYISELSKQVVGGLGEAVGINYVASSDRKALRKRLAQVDDQDYFEGGMELAIHQDGARFRPVDISDVFAVEVDFPEDLDRANEGIDSGLLPS
ncbi:conserved hypothetical protein [Beutenbergia cavernae DSM 12333]|uniref:MobA-like NTP transferase domain-containing protein n=1 Tax=Beutenbergia cavernae (strain ATCC BAA-8 / DSM 12333 / CCUG 43141 / JCM 11478 / NBRC 16432 / NCIMB 13614 / HKI 0122) TaxID=471853 RepID=C5C129_BEUC1|nr:phosphocholine cytidylyltransferase family protein [Beutenbergia cavernae]ACQ79433.1 conserved hypothetical protein [Beutenbergia cavernae DSM 12333]